MLLPQAPAQAFNVPQDYRRLASALPALAAGA
jgi:hypothetical protein